MTTAQYAVTVRFDGGCQGNPGRKYGSYRIEDEVVVIAQESRFELGRGTNNEAEFEALGWETSRCDVSAPSRRGPAAR